jgi:hypothetical protein
MQDYMEATDGRVALHGDVRVALEEQVPVTDRQRPRATGVASVHRGACNGSSRDAVQLAPSVAQLQQRLARRVRARLA